MRRGGHGTKRSAIHAALQEYVRMRKQLDLLALKGKVRWVGDLEQMRRNRSS
jgi:hypothetical protein